MADHPISTWIYYADAWREITSDVFQGAPLKLTRGGAEISEAPKPNGIDLRLLDKRGDYQPHNPNSVLYGQTSRNTPMMVGTLVAYEDFEDATLAVSISQGSSTNGWARSTTSPHTGTWCFKSGVTADGSFSDAIITVPTGANVCTLWYRTDCDAADRLRISTGGQLRRTVGGTGGTWTSITVPVMANSSGVREVFIRYLKDAGTTGGADAVYIDDVQFFTAVNAGEASWSPDPGNPGDPAFTDVSAKGLLQRIGTWTEPLQSAFSREIEALFPSTTLGFWPGEDGREASAMGNRITGGKSAQASGVTFGDSDSPAGGSTSMKLSATSKIRGTFANGGNSTGWQVSWTFKLSSAAPTANPVFTWATSDGKLWTFGVDPTGYSIQVSDNNAGGLLENLLTGFGLAGEPNQWVTMRLSASISGTTVSWQLGWYAENNTVTSGVSDTFTSSSIGRLTVWKVDGNATLDDGFLGYVYAVNGTTDNLLGGNIIAGLNGWSGETAVARFMRLMLNAGLPYVVRGVARNCEIMGPQRPDSLLELLNEIQQTDGGVLADFEGMPAVVYRPRVDLYNQTPALALTYGVNVAPPLKPVLDDLNTHNFITVENRNGGSAVAEDSTSIMGSQPPPDGAGLAKQTVNVNVSDETRLPHLAEWWRALGTNPEPRYSAVTVDLDANPSLEAPIEALLPGDRITITNLLPDLVDLLFIGITDKRDTQKRRTATMLCVPYKAYSTGIWDDTTKRYDSRTSTLNAGYSSSATSLVVTFTDPNDAWSAVNAPYDWIVAGERIRVTSMGAVTGAGPYTQTATVTRSINGVSKSQVAGEPVHMHPEQQARYAL